MKVIESLSVSNYTMLTFDRPIFPGNPEVPKGFTKIIIDGIAYRPEIAYDAPNSIGIVGNIDATGKDAQFV